MIVFKQKIYTDSDIVIEEKGHLKEALAHILKLLYGFNLMRDRNKHKGDLYNNFLEKSISKMNSSRYKSHGPKAILKRFDDIFDFRWAKKEIEKEFRKNYGFSDKEEIDPKVFERAIDILRELILLFGDEQKVKERIKQISNEFQRD